MTKVLFVIAPQFRDPEYFTPKEILEGAGFETATASFSTGEVVGAEGGKAQADYAVTQVEPAEFAAVAFIGGPGMVPKVADAGLIALAKKFGQANKLVAAICAACAVLANAGLLSGKKATSWSGVETVLTNAGATYTGQPVEVDGKIITAEGPAVAAAFGKALVEAVK